MAGVYVKSAAENHRKGTWSDGWEGEVVSEVVKRPEPAWVGGHGKDTRVDVKRRRLAGTGERIPCPYAAVAQASERGV